MRSRTGQNLLVELLNRELNDGGGIGDLIGFDTSPSGGNQIEVSNNPIVEYPVSGYQPVS